MLNLPPHFILIDDDPINNYISHKIIKQVASDANILTFYRASEALKYIHLNYTTKELPETIVFLDINMPEINGWEFLNTINHFSLPLKSNLVIYILTSSINPEDIKHVKNNNYVVNYIKKPLSKTNVLDIISKLSLKLQSASNHQ